MSQSNHARTFDRLVNNKRDECMKHILILILYLVYIFTKQFSYKFIQNPVQCPQSSEYAWTNTMQHIYISHDAAYFKLGIAKQPFYTHDVTVLRQRDRTCVLFMYLRCVHRHLFATNNNQLPNMRHTLHTHAGTKTINIALVNFSLLPWMLTGTYRHCDSALFIPSSPMNLVEFGTGLFLSKTPSEEAPQDVFSTSGYVMSRSAQVSMCQIVMCCLWWRLYRPQRHIVFVLALIFWLSLQTFGCCIKIFNIYILFCEANVFLS